MFVRLVSFYLDDVTTRLPVAGVNSWGKRPAIEEVGKSAHMIGSRFRTVPSITGVGNTPNDVLTCRRVRN